MKIKTTSVDAILFTLMVLFPIFNMRALLGVAIIPLGDYINEIVYICLISLCGIRIMQSGRADKSIIWLLLFAGYFLLQIFVLNLPATSAVQAFLYLQAPIYLYYFFSKTPRQKEDLIKALSKVMVVLTYIVVIVAVIECIIPQYVSQITLIQYTNRGINNWFYIGSIFGSNIALSHFCILSITFYFINRFLYHRKIYGNLIVALLFVIMFLVFSRKEMMLFILFAISSFYVIKYKKLNIRGIIGLGILVLPVTMIYIANYFAEANETALTDDYVRFRILMYSKEIFVDYFPFGSGIGTFGSQMSLVNDKIYTEYNVDADIIGVESRGPIYDLFLPTFTSEMGLGIIIFFAFFIYLWRKPFLQNNPGLRHIKRSLILMFIIICIFAPLWMNSFGLLLIAILGLISDSQSPNKQNAVYQTI